MVTTLGLFSGWQAKIFKIRPLITKEPKVGNGSPLFPSADGGTFVVFVLFYSADEEQLLLPHHVRQPALLALSFFQIFRKYIHFSHKAAEKSDLKAPVMLW